MRDRGGHLARGDGKREAIGPSCARGGVYSSA
jgi:hypothetical protein